MATSLYDLAVNVSTNTASLETGFNKVSDLIRQQTKQWQQGFDNVKGTLLNLAAGFVSVGAAVQSIRSAVRLGDDLKQMADTTGLAIDKLDELSIIAGQNGAALGDMAKAFKFLGTSMIEAQNASSKAGQLFTALGVSVKDAKGNLRGVDDVMKDVAAALQSIDNETTRAAVGTEIFGKSYQQIAATLRNYEKDQEAANLILEKFGGVSATAANLADDLGDKFTLLAEGSKRALLGAMVPGMAAVVEMLNRMIEGGGRFQSGFGQVVSWVAEVASKAFINLADFINKTGIAIGAVAASIATMSLEPFRAMNEELAKLEAKRQGDLAAIRTAAMFPGLDNSDQISRAAGAQERANKATADAAALNKILAPAVKATADAAKTAADEYAKLEQALLKTIAGIDGLTESEKLQFDLLKTKVSPAQQEMLQFLAATADFLKEREEATKRAIDADKEFAQTTEKLRDAYVKVIASADELVKNLEFETDALTMTNQAREVAIKLRELERVGVQQGTAEWERYAAAISSAVERKNALQSQIDLWQNIEQTAEDAFMHIFEGGRSVFERLTDSLKSTLLRVLYEMTLKRWVINIGTEITGNAGLLGGAASLAGGSLNPLSLLGGAGNWLSSGGIFSGGLGGAFATSGIGQALGLSTLAEFSTGSMALTTLGTTLGAAIPIIGAGLAIAKALGAFSSGGGPKQGGTAGFQSYYPGETTAAANTEMQAAITAIQSSYDQLVAALGGTGTAAFALGFDTDPRGKAGSRVSAAATVGGTSVYSLRDLDVGRDPAALQAQLQTQAQRALLAALRASDLPKYLADILDNINIDVASAQDIQNLLAYASAAKAAVDSIQGLGGAFATLDPAQILAVGDALGGIDAATQGFAYLQQNFTTAAAKLEQAQQQLTKSFEALGLVVPKTHADFLQLVNDLIALGDAAGAASVIGLADLFVQVNGTADQAAEAVSNLNEAMSTLEERAAQMGTVIVDVGTVISEGYAKAANTLGKFEQLASNAPDFGAKLSLQLNLIADAIQKTSSKGFTTPLAYDVYISQLKKTQKALADELSRFTILSAQFDAQRAEQLVGLQDWYTEQQKLFSGNAAALSAVETIFQQKWAAIVNGVSSGVDGAIDQLTRLREGIADYLKGLLISDLSPLTPQEKLQQAQSDYVDTLLRAQSGDLAALGDITKYADAYLKQARDFFASSPAYSDIFAGVTGQLSGLAAPAISAAPTQGDIQESTQATRDLETTLVALLTGQHAEDMDLGGQQLDALRSWRTRQTVLAR